MNVVVRRPITELDYSLLTLLYHWYNTGIYEEFKEHSHSIVFLFHVYWSVHCKVA